VLLLLIRQGRRVARVTPSGTDTFFYDMGGRLLATYLGQSAVGSEQSAVGSKQSNPSTPELTVYMAGQKLGQYTDRIGSVRYANTGGVVSHYYPYGELVAGASNTGPAWRDSPKPTATTPAWTTPWPVITRPPLVASSASMAGRPLRLANPGW